MSERISEVYVAGGQLAAALAKAQASFAKVTKDKTVTVQKKTGGSYSFSYAPLESILEATRQPLADNGLVIVQLLDDGDLVTMLLHDSGAVLSGHVALPGTEDIQGYGSAITYLRRYAIQALLGIAAEDDDDGNRAAGNQTETTAETRATGNETEKLLGKVDVKGKAIPGGSARYQGEWHEGPDGHVIGFKLSRNGDKDIPQVLVMGPIGAAMFIADSGAKFMGTTVQAKGRLYAVTSPGRTTYNRLIVGEGTDSFIETDEYRIPALDSDPPAGQETAPEDAPSPGQVAAFDVDADLDAVAEAMA